MVRRSYRFFRRWGLIWQRYLLARNNLSESLPKRLILSSGEVGKVVWHSLVLGSVVHDGFAIFNGEQVNVTA